MNALRRAGLAARFALVLSASLLALVMAGSGPALADHAWYHTAYEYVGDTASGAAESIGNAASGVADTVGSVAGKVGESFDRALDVASGTYDLISGTIEWTASAPDEKISAVLAESCTACLFASKLIAAADTFAFNAFDKLRDPVARIVNYTFALWVLMQGMYLMLGMGPGRDPGTILWALATRAATFFIVIGLLNAAGSQTFWDNFYNLPIQEAAKGAALISSTTGTASPVSGCSFSVPATAKLDPAAFKDMICLVEKVEKVNKLGMVFGYYLFANFSGSMLDIFAKFLFALFIGVVLIIVFALGTIYFTFFVVDVFLKITFLTAFSPFFIAFFVFRPTRHYATSAINGFLSALFGLMAASAVYGFSATLIFQIPSLYFASAAGGAGGPGGGSSGGNPIAEFTRMLEALNYQNFELLAGYVWFAIIAGLATIALTKKFATEIAAIFGGSVATTMGDKALGLTKMAGMAALGVVTAGAGAAAFGAASGTLRSSAILNKMAVNGARAGIRAAGSEGQA